MSTRSSRGDHFRGRLENEAGVGSATATASTGRTGAVARGDPSFSPVGWNAGGFLHDHPFTFPGKGIRLSRPRDVHKLVTPDRLNPTWLSSFTRTTGSWSPLSPVHIPQPSGREGPPRGGPGASPPASCRESRRRPSPRAAVSVSLVTLSPHRWSLDKGPCPPGGLSTATRT